MIVFAKVHDREKFIADYGEPAGALVAKFGGEYMARGPGVAALEGGLFEGHSAVISKWPDRSAIERFWNSPEYEKLKTVRRPLADCHVMVVDAL